MTIWMSRNLRSRSKSLWEIMQGYCIKTSSNICFGYLLELPHWGDSNKYPKHMFYEEIRIKQGCYISFCPLRILYNSKFMLMATSLGTNVVVTRVHFHFFFISVSSFILWAACGYSLEVPYKASSKAYHIENMPIQIYWKFYNQKRKIFK